MRGIWGEKKPQGFKKLKGTLMFPEIKEFFFPRQNRYNRMRRWDRFGEKFLAVYPYIQGFLVYGGWIYIGYHIWVLTGLLAPRIKTLGLEKEASELVSILWMWWIVKVWSSKS